MFSCHRCCYKVFKGCHVRPHIYKHLHLFAETWCQMNTSSRSALINAPLNERTNERTSWNEWTAHLSLFCFSFFSLLLLFTFNITLFHYLTMTMTSCTRSILCLSSCNFLLLLHVHAQRMVVPLCFFAHSKKIIPFCSIKIGMQISDMYGVSLCVYMSNMRALPHTILFRFAVPCFSICFSVTGSPTFSLFGSQTGSSKFNSV